jgi:hypothetical protein
VRELGDMKFNAAMAQLNALAVRSVRGVTQDELLRLMQSFIEAGDCFLRAEVPYTQNLPWLHSNPLSYFNS